MKTCTICNNNLVGKQTRYCSDSCKNLAYRMEAAESYRRSTQDKLCGLVECSAPFAGRKGKKYCSLKCSAISRARTKDESVKRQRNQHKKDTKSFYGRSYRYIKDYSAIDSGFF